MKKLLLGMLAWIATIGFAFGAVNINTATKEQLDSLKGIGPTKAQAIIDYRTKHGPFKSVDDLEKVPGIGPATLKDIRNDVTLTGATTPAKGSDKSTAAKKDDTKGSVRADQKATKKAEEKKKSDEKPAAPKKDEAKTTTKGDATKSGTATATDAKDEKKTEKK